MSLINPVILIGAARSGTKMLRDIIATHPDIAKISFDINFVWKYDNEQLPHDALTVADLDNKKKLFIQQYFDKAAVNKSFLIEKTVSNSLRIDFVKAVFPNAKFIYLTRDGRDVIESVARQWGKSPSNNYLFEKIKSFPILKTVSYGFDYGLDLLKIKAFGKPSSSYVWGVKYPNYQEDLNKKDILKFCAIQWKNCIEYSEKQIVNIPSKQLFKIQYENFVDNPAFYLQKVSDFLGITPNFNQEMINNIDSSNVGKGFNNLDSKQRETVLSIIQPTLNKLHYN